MNKRFLLLAFLALLPGVLGAQQRTYNTTLFDTLNPGVQGWPWSYSALTGYAAPDGREYALLGSYTGTHIIDVTSKPIREVAYIEGPKNSWREMKTYGTYAYVVTEGGGGLQIIDLSKLPASATLVRSDARYFNKGHTITQEGTFIYVHGTNLEAEANGGTIIFDLSKNPTDPVLVGKWTGRYVHDAAIRNDTLYAAAINDGAGLDIVYLGKDRKNPVQVANITYPGAGTHNADLTVDGRYILTTDEVNTTPKTLKVWDRRDIDNIIKVADYTPAPGEVIHNVHVKGKLAVIAWYTAGTRIIDISDPTDPAEIAFFDQWSGSNGGYRGNWEVYPWLPSGKMIASDMANGLYVFTCDVRERGSVYGVVRDLKTGQPIPGARIFLPMLGRTIIADGAGKYRFPGAIDTLDYVASKVDYTSRGGTFRLAMNGGEHDIMLVPMENVQITVMDNVGSTLLHDFSYRVINRAGSGGGAAAANPETLRLSKDTIYHIEVAAWGYMPRVVDLDSNSTNVVSVRLERGYFDDAELDLGWSYSAPDDDSTGGWGRGVPVPGTIQTFKGNIQISPATDHTPGTATDAFMTGLEADPTTGDVNGPVTLTSPLFDLTGYSDPWLNFALWYADVNVVTTGSDDTLPLLLSNDGGLSWTPIAHVDSTTGGWALYHLRVSDFLAPTSRMLFRVVAHDTGRSSFLRVGLDDFSVTEGVGAGVEDSPAGIVGVEVAVHPNPVGATATLGVTLGMRAGNGKLELYDLLGKRVMVLHDGPMPQGESRFVIDGRNLPAGGYRWRLMLDDGRMSSGAVVVVQ